MIQTVTVGLILRTPSPLNPRNGTTRMGTDSAMNLMDSKLMPAHQNMACQQRIDLDVRTQMVMVGPI